MLCRPQQASLTWQPLNERAPPVDSWRGKAAAQWQDRPSPNGGVDTTAALIGGDSGAGITSRQKCDSTLAAAYASSVEPIENFQQQQYPVTVNQASWIGLREKYDICVQTGAVHQTLPHTQQRTPRHGGSTSSTPKPLGGVSEAPARAARGNRFTAEARGAKIRERGREAG